MGPEYKLFSTNLDRAVFEPRDETPLSPEASERTPYLRENSTPPSFRPLVTSKEGFANVPPGTIFGGEVNGARNPVSIAGANNALTHIVVWSKPPLVEGAGSPSIYQWVDGDLEPVGVLPVDEGGDIVPAQLGSGIVSGRHAVSRTCPLSSGPQRQLSQLTGGQPMPALYVRDTLGNETGRLDIVQEGGSGSGQARTIFMGADTEGSVVFFTDVQQLTEGASAKGQDLYRCEVGDVEGSLGCAELET